MKFVVTINLGNAAMCNRMHIVDALRQISRKLLANSGNRLSGDEGKVLDANGNSCGYWRFEE